MNRKCQKTILRKDLSVLFAGRCPKNSVCYLAASSDSYLTANEGISPEMQFSVNHGID